MKEYTKTAKMVVQKPWSLLRAGRYLDKWVADNQAGTYGAPPTIPLLTTRPLCAPDWEEEMAVEWQNYAPAPPVGSARQEKCGDRPRDVIPQSVNPVAP